MGYVRGWKVSTLTRRDILVPVAIFASGANTQPGELSFTLLEFFIVPRDSAGVRAHSCEIERVEAGRFPPLPLSPIWKRGSRPPSFPISCCVDPRQSEAVESAVREKLRQTKLSFLLDVHFAAKEGQAKKTPRRATVAMGDARGWKVSTLTRRDILVPVAIFASGANTQPGELSFTLLEFFIVPRDSAGVRAHSCEIERVEAGRFPPLPLSPIWKRGSRPPSFPISCCVDPRQSEAVQSPARGKLRQTKLFFRLSQSNLKRQGCKLVQRTYRELISGRCGVQYPSTSRLSRLCKKLLPSCSSALSPLSLSGVSTIAQYAPIPQTTVKIPSRICRYRRSVAKTAKLDGRRLTKIHRQLPAVISPPTPTIPPIANASRPERKRNPSVSLFFKRTKGSRRRANAAKKQLPLKDPVTRLPVHQRAAGFECGIASVTATNKIKFTINHCGLDCTFLDFKFSRVCSPVLRIYLQ